jgi:hypothetical protein
MRRTLPNFCRVSRQRKFPASREFNKEFTKIAVTAFALSLPYSVKLIRVDGSARPKPPVRES